MKSRDQALIERGYLAKGSELEFIYLSYSEKLNFLKSKDAINRTIGARLLVNSKNKDIVEHLIGALKVETKLYTKIEICNSLVSIGESSIYPLVKILGKIGANQHKGIPKTQFKKSNYPLPRDIASRTLIRIGNIALPELLNVLESNCEDQISEAIDAIGYICFYEYKAKIYDNLKVCYTRFDKSDLIKWKIIRAMSGFAESKNFLLEQKNNSNSKHLLLEIKRSLFLIEKRQSPNK